MKRKKVVRGILGGSSNLLSTGLAGFTGFDTSEGEPSITSQSEPGILRELLGCAVMIGVEIFKARVIEPQSKLKQPNDVSTTHQPKPLQITSEFKVLKVKPKRLRAGMKTERVWHECLAMYLDQKKQGQRADWSPIVAKVRDQYRPSLSNKTVGELVRSRVMKLHQRMLEEQGN